MVTTHANIEAQITALVEAWGWRPDDRIPLFLPLHHVHGIVNVLDLLLVLANDYLILYVGWEGVGLCSYLLIGFWYADRFNAYCGSKAFIVNRIGDFGFLVGIFLLFWSLADAGDTSARPNARQAADCFGLMG